MFNEEKNNFIEFVRWAIYTLAKLALCQLNNAESLIMGMTEFVYVSRETNELIKLINFSLKKDEKFLEKAGVITPAIMPSWICDPDEIISKMKKGNQISQELRAKFLRPSIEGDNLLITAGKMKILKIHLDAIINAYESEIGSIEKVTVAGDYILDVSYCYDINVPDQYSLAKSLLMGEYDNYYPIDLGTSAWILTGAQLKAKGLL
jgi:hypothetical protein